MASKSSTVNLSNQLPHSTYAIQTAHNLLNHYGIKFSKLDVESQLSDEQSFYKRLLKIPALTVYNRYLLDKCQHMQSYCQQQLFTIMLASERTDIRTLETSSTLNSSQRDQYNQIEQQAKQLNHRLQQLEKRQKILDKQTQTLVNSHHQHWNTLLAEAADKFTQQLQGLGFTLSKDFRGKLLANLKIEATKAKIANSTLCEELQIKQQLSGIEHAVLATLLEEQKHDHS